MDSSKHIALVLLLLFCSMFTQAERQRAYLLGGRGTNYSDLTQGQLRRNNGLRTGMYSNVHHLFGAYVDGGYSCMFNTIPLANATPGGYDIGGGLCYELQSYHFKFQVGIGAKWQNVLDSVARIQFEDNTVYDARGYNYTIYYDFYNRGDRSRNLHAQVPILFGGGWYKAYFLAGFKLNYTIWGDTHIRSFGTTTGRYEQYLGHFVEMDNHGLRKNVPIDQHRDGLNLKFDMLASLEVGYEWGKERPRGHYSDGYTSGGHKIHHESRYKVAIYADYGVLNISPKTNFDAIHIPSDYKWDFPKYEMNHIYSSKEATLSNNRLNNFYVGVKLTVLIGFYTHEECILCPNGWKSEYDMSNPYLNMKWSR